MIEHIRRLKSKNECDSFALKLATITIVIIRTETVEARWINS